MHNTIKVSLDFVEFTQCMKEKIYFKSIETTIGLSLLFSRESSSIFTILICFYSS